MKSGFAYASSSIVILLFYKGFGIAESEKRNAVFESAAGGERANYLTICNVLADVLSGTEQ